MTTVDQGPEHDARPRCGGPKRQGEGTCTQAAGWGTDHPGIGRCKLHGGSTSSHTKAAELEQARRDVLVLGARRDIHPAEALIELVQFKAGEVDYWRGRVQELDEKRLTWGKTKRKQGGEDRGTTFEARPNVAYVLLREAERDLAAYCAAALKAGVDERRVRLAESYGHQLASVIQGILRDLELTEAQVELTATVVPLHLRAVVAGEVVA